MRAKDRIAVIQLFDLLEARYALRVIWALSDGHPQTFRLLQDSVGGVTPNTLNTRLKQLRAARLVDHGGDGYRLTSQGTDLARRLVEVQQFAPKWVQRQNRLAALPRSAASDSSLQSTAQPLSAA
ncbi:MAG: helix-turn-helix transcriptional regulator [Hydrogenophaga sp.]|jgi:DNA-binding HxlR family transcriptional regulator|nr:helix-turn-helix transcriptional regulator [Hydrogenophaga sp.]